MAQPSTIYKPGKLNYVWNYLGTTLKEFKVKLLGYRSYTALLNQTGTDAPIATVLENTLGGDITWETPSSTGYYRGLATGLFSPEAKTFVTCSQTDFGSVLGVTYAYRNNDDQIIVETYDTTFTASDDVLANTVIEIRVYL